MSQLTNFRAALLLLLVFGLLLSFQACDVRMKHQEAALHRHCLQACRGGFIKDQGGCLCVSSPKEAP